MNEERIATLLEDLTGRPARMHFAAMHDLIVAKIVDNPIQARSARERLQEVTKDAMGAAEVLGARVTLQTVVERTGSTAMSRRIPDALFGEDQSVLPRVTFEEALADLSERVPVTIKNAAQRTAQAISRLYSEGRYMAFANAAEAKVTEVAADFLRRAFEEGLTENIGGEILSGQVERVRQLSKPWTQSYSRMVFRTNLNTGITAGRFRQAQDPDIRTVLPAFQFDAVGDGDTRDNHRAANGLVMAVDDPRWSFLAPPLGYNCRCQIRAVDAITLDTRGMMDADGQLRRMSVPATARPDPGFRHGGRPDLMGIG